MTKVKIAIDGPAVSGKSTAAKHLARRLGYLYLDSGAVYRCVTLAHMSGLQIDQEELFSALDELEIRLVAKTDGLGCDVWMKGENVSQIIRTQEVTDHILPISGNPQVREWVTDFLRSSAKHDHVVMDGRDIGSVVFPDADYKFYIEASLEARANRRLKDLDKNEKHLTREEILVALHHRDEGDKKRKIGPLLKVEDAVLIDNSSLDLVETVDTMLQHIQHREES